MRPQKPAFLFLLFVILVSLGSCFGSQLRHEHFSLLTRANRAAPVRRRSPVTVNVDDFGAKSGDGGDDTKAFEKAWNEACSKGAALVVPEKKIYHLKQITFSGPCQPNTAFTINGTIKAWPHMSSYGNEDQRRHWIVFENITNFRVDGGGTFNGNGRKWWLNSCKINKSLPCKVAPTAVTFSECNNLRITNLRFKNAQQMHLTIQYCTNVRVSNVVVKAPGHSPNTDGIHISATENIVISNSIIGTGDDCVSIVSGSKNVRVQDITCGPGHGISIGSLGADNSEAEVSNVLVNRAKLTGTTNGVRIKTWQGGSGYARNIKFMNIAMQNVTNPIIIDQNYCDQEEACPQQASAVALSNVLYQNIRGTSASEVAVNFDCSRTVPCSQIYIQDVVLHQQGNQAAAIASCKNVRYVNKGNFSPGCTSSTNISN